MLILQLAVVLGINGHEIIREVNLGLSVQKHVRRVQRFVPSLDVAVVDVLQDL